MTGSWTQSFEVRSNEIDPDGRLSVPALCNYLQQAASAHAVDLGISIGDLGRDNLTWVLGRLQLRVGRLPGCGDAVEVTTWPSRLRSYFVLRDFLVRDARDGELARATSTWFVIDVERRRAVRVPELIRNVRLPERERAMSETWARLRSPGAPQRRGRFTIGRGDLDVNVHVNHVRYLEWALDTLDLEFFEQQRLSELEVDFLAELTGGDTVTTEAEIVADSDGATRVLVSVRGERAAVEAARVSTRWLPVAERQ